ncbi:MAG: hypothetical protein KQH57_18640 [Actinomycetales bacterium]|nr:hypothetical protein [Actinomycetales bacterium]
MGGSELRAFRDRFWAALGEWNAAHPSVYPIVTTIAATVGGALLTVVLWVGVGLLVLVAAVIFAETKSAASWQTAFRKEAADQCEALRLADREAHQAVVEELRHEGQRAVAKGAKRAKHRAQGEQRLAFDAGLSPLIESVQVLIDAAPSRRRSLMQATYANTVNAISLLVGGGNPASLRTVIYLVDEATNAEPRSRSMSVGYEHGRRPLRAKPLVEGGPRGRRPFSDLDDGRARIVADIEDDPEHDGLEPNGYRSYGLVPIVSTEGKRYGLLWVDSPIVSGLNQLHEPALDVIARVLALALKVHDSAGRRAGTGQV